MSLLRMPDQREQMACEARGIQVNTRKLLKPGIGAITAEDGECFLIGN